MQIIELQDIKFQYSYQFMFTDYGNIKFKQSAKTFGLSKLNTECWKYNKYTENSTVYMLKKC